MLTPYKFSPVVYFKGDCYEKLACMSPILFHPLIGYRTSLNHLHHCKTLSACDSKKNICFVSCSHTFHTPVLPCGVLTNSHLPCLTSEIVWLLLPCLISASACTAKCNTPRLPCFWCTLPPCPHSQADGHLQAAACHSYPLSMSSTCSSVLCNRPVEEPLNMPCIYNDALPLKTFCHPGHMGVLLFINSKGFQLGICGWPPGGLRV